jgi:hypothetical protein
MVRLRNCWRCRSCRRGGTTGYGKGEEFPYIGFINQLHYMALQNHDKLLANRIGEGSNRYFAFQESPLQIAETQTGGPLVDYIIDGSHGDILSRLDNQELNKILDLPEEVSDKFFAGITQSESRVFIDRRKSEILSTWLTTNSWWDVNHRCVLVTELNELFSVDTDKTETVLGYETALFQRDEDATNPSPVSVYCVQTKLPTKIGSLESIEFHRKLDSSASYRVFNTKGVENLILYKMHSMWFSLLLYTALYIGYLFAIMFCQWTSVIAAFAAQ